MEIEVSQERCTGHARCNAEAPDLFPLDENGYNIASSFVVAEGDEERATRAAEACPEQAIVVITK